MRTSNKPYQVGYLALAGYLFFSSPGFAWDVNHNLTSSGARGRTLYRYFIDPQSYHLYRGTCSNPQLKPTRTACSDGLDNPRNRVSTESFFAYYNPHFERTYKALLQRTVEQTVASDFLRNVPFLAQWIDIAKRRKKTEALQAQLDDFNKTYEALLNLRQKLQHGYVTYQYLQESNGVWFHDPDGNKKLVEDKASLYFLKNIDQAFKSAGEARGPTCRRDLGNYVSKYGGCWDGKSLVWSGHIQTGLTGVSDNEVWDNKLSAAKYCRSLSLGGYTGWRAPRISEYEDLSNTGIDAINWNPQAAYWALDDKDAERFQKSFKRYADSIETAGNLAETKIKNIWGDAIDYYVSGDITSVARTERRIEGDLQTFEDNNFAYIPRPAAEASHLRQIKRTEILLAAAQYKELYKQTKLSVVNSQRYGSFFYGLEVKQFELSEPDYYFAVFADPRSEDFNDLPDGGKVALVCVRDDDGTGGL